MGERPRLRPLHLRNAAAPQGAGGDDLDVLRDRRHDPLHVLLERERGALPAASPRRGCRPHRRPEPRVDHRRHPPLQGEALHRAARRPRGIREGAEGGPVLPASPPDHRRRLLDGGRDRPASRAGRPLRPVRDDPRRRRLARHGRPRDDGPRHGGAARRERPDPDPHLDAREGDGLGGRRLHYRPERRRRPSPSAIANDALFQLAPTRGRRIVPRGVPDADGGPGAGEEAPARTRSGSGEK